MQDKVMLVASCTLPVQIFHVQEYWVAAVERDVRIAASAADAQQLTLVAGCTLPVEMFFPEEEYPIEAVEQELQQLGVMSSVLPDLVPPYAVNNSSKQLTDSEGKRLAGFSMKSAAVLLSSFEEVRTLDRPSPCLKRSQPCWVALHTCINCAAAAVSPCVSMSEAGLKSFTMRFLQVESVLLITQCECWLGM